MEKSELRKIAGEIFNYNPSFLKEEFSCVLGPILANVGLRKFMPNISKPLNKKEISQKLKEKDLNLSVEEIIDLEPWDNEGGHMRTISSYDKDIYVLGSYFFD